MEEQKKTILITGGAGFIGSHLCEKYLDEGHRIICVDNLQTTFKPKNIERFLSNKNFKFIKQDIIHPLYIKEKIDWIFNAACAGSYTSYQYDPVHTIKTNTQGVINILEIAKKNNARIMQFSTSEVYGDPIEFPQKESYFGNVNSLGPRACYDEGKRCAETLCMDYHREYGVDIKIIRIFNTYGPNMDINDGRAITNFIFNALNKKDIIIYGNGANTRSFQYIDDLIDGIDKMIRKDNFIGPVNLGNPGEISMFNLAEKIKEKTKSSSNIIFRESVTDDPKRRCPEIKLAKEKLNWEPKISLNDGLKKTIDYFKNIERADKKILIFATTYYPNLGPAEKALFELSKQMQDTQFYIVTTKFEKKLQSFEKKDNNHIYRIGVGSKLDKYLLPILGVIKAQELIKNNNFRFIWSIMGSYGGVSAVIIKIFNHDLNFLLSLDDNELTKKKTIKSKFLYPIQRWVFKKADTIYTSELHSKNESKILKDLPNIYMQEGDTKSFVNKVKLTYTELLNKQERKLNRPK